ncbi:MAG: MBL fold metallo-hydrolase [Bacillota bacterium]
MTSENKGDFIKFLGTAGARFVVSRQLRSSGGLWFELGGEKILVDPGPGSLVKCLSSRPKMDPARLDGIILTHRHLDHANDVNVIIEAMSDGGRKRKGFLFGPRDAFEGPDPVVQLYVRSFLGETAYLQADGELKRSSFTLKTPVLHQHPVETYGLQFLLPYGNISLIADTAFFPELAEHYRGADILILNVVIFQDNLPKRIYHLNYGQARELIRKIKPRLAILTHFGLTMLQEKPYLLARQLQQELKIRVIAANDGLLLPLIGESAGEPGPFLGGLIKEDKK